MFPSFETRRGPLAAAIAVVALLALAATPSHAFRMIQLAQSGLAINGRAVTCSDTGGFAHWNVSLTGWLVHPGNQGQSQIPALQGAMAAWTNVAGAAHKPIYLGTTTSSWTIDGLNTIAWTNFSGCVENCLALTSLILQPGQVIVEADILFNNQLVWGSSGFDWDTQGIATHELGHALGIHHAEFNTPGPPTMHPLYPGPDQRTLEADDIAALQCSQGRYPVTPGPASPSSLNVYPLACYGWVDVAWSPSMGAASYELQQASSPNFGSAYTIYSGPDLFLTTNGVGTRYFRVRACNADGCSAWRQSGFGAPYYPYCL